jgi:ribosomal protein S18 acetylase RimI-like enzyme
MHTIEIHELAEVTDEHVEAFARLLPQLSSNAKALEREDIEEIMRHDACTVLLAMAENGRIVGALTLVTFPIPTGLRARIEDVVVDAGARGQGVGGALTDAALTVARARGARTVDLTSRPSREAANHLYRKLGFAERDSRVYRYEFQS